MNSVDQVVGALLSAVATLETLLEMDRHSHIIAASTLESITQRLGAMSDEERREFQAAILRVAAAYDRTEPGSGNWVRVLPRSLGVS